uniref:uncharacterized protein isoform X2 n=1 Tax=Myxine glutinosa TaxID=7769 RepID=UPI00358E778F
MFLKRWEETWTMNNFVEQQFEGLVVGGKRKRTVKAPTIFYDVKPHKPSKSLQQRSSNNITTRKVVKNIPSLPKHSYCAAAPADSLSWEPDRVNDCGDKKDGFEMQQMKVEYEHSTALEEVAREPEGADRVNNCGDKIDGFEMLQMKVEDVQCDGPEEVARQPEGAERVNGCGDKMEEFGVLPIKVENLQSDDPEDVGREETQMTGMLAEKHPQVLNSMQDLESKLQELQQEFEHTQGTRERNSCWEGGDSTHCIDAPVPIPPKHPKAP